MYRRLFFLLMTTLLISVSLAQELKSNSTLPDASTFKEVIKGGLESKGLVTGLQEMPISKLYFVEAEQGTYLISSDGRFVFEGILKDVWHRKTIRTVKDVTDTQRTPVSNLGFKPEEQLAHFVIGNPELPRQGVAFVDPTSQFTQLFLKEILSEPNSNWTVVLLPLVGGNQAVDRSLRLWCSVDRKLALQDFINGTSLSFSNIKEGCNDEKIVMGMMLTDLFRIVSLPHLIREDGLVSNGFPENFKEWFKQP